VGPAPLSTMPAPITALVRRPAFLLLALLAMSGGVRAEPPPAPSGLTKTDSGLHYAITLPGNGPQPQAGQVVIYHYVGTLEDGTVFDSSRTRNKPFAFTLGRGQVIKGVEEAFTHLRVGDHATMILPPALAYGDKQRGLIPPNSTLRFDVEVLGVRDHALGDVLKDKIDSAGIEAARALLAELKATQFAGLHVDENQLNMLGYRYLMNREKEQLAEALAVFQWNVELFPASGNVYDSLAEALRKSGDRAGAIRNYEKSLELDPKNENAKKCLAELRK